MHPLILNRYSFIPLLVNNGRHLNEIFLIFFTDDHLFHLFIGIIHDIEKVQFIQDASQFATNILKEYGNLSNAHKHPPTYVISSIPLNLYLSNSPFMKVPS